MSEPAAQVKMLPSSLSREKVAEHNSRESCWIIVHGMSYHFMISRTIVTLTACFQVMRMMLLNFLMVRGPCIALPLIY